MVASPAPAPFVLHAVVWHHGQIGIWAERADAKGRCERPTHPFAASLNETLAALAILGRLGGFALELRLPTHQGRPIPSWEAKPGRWATWRVDVAELPMARAIGVLAGLTETPRRRLGPEFLWLQALARWATALVTAGLVRPGLLGGSRGVSVWQPVLAGPEATARLTAFDTSRPAALTAGAREGVPLSTLDLLTALVDGAARSVLQQGGWPPTKAGLVLRRADWAMHWLQSLAAETGIVNLTDAQQEMLRDHLVQIRVAGAGPERRYHLCLRLQEPDSPAGQDWPMAILLQADDDPAVTIDLADVRSGEVARQPAMATEAARLPEIVRRLLWQAAPAFAPLWPVAQPDGPGRLTLTTGEVQRLLTEAAPKLLSRGVTVEAPAWWQGQPSAMQVSLTVQPTKASDLGLAAMCGFEWRVAVGDQALSDDEFQRLIGEQRALIQVKGQWVVLRPEELAEVAQATAQTGTEPVSLLDAMRLTADLATGSAAALSVQGQDWLADLFDTREPDRVTPVAVPDTFLATLRPYQERGLAWLAFTSRRHLGACLADDMGLGKTVQLLALLAWERAEGKSFGPTLLVCPMSLVGNWQRETARFVPSLRVHVHHGGGRNRGAALAAAASDADLVITTYGLLGRDQAALAPIPWARIVLDEAQHIKNPQSRQAKAAMTLRAPHRVAMTGTPVENRLAELWSIMQFLNPGLLGSFGQFQKTYAGTAARPAEPSALTRLKRLTAPFILRRRKQDPGIAPDLPEKWEITATCNLTREQAALYKAVVDEMMARIRDEAGMKRKGLILATMTRLKQICDHPALVLDDGAPLAGRSGKLESLEDALTDILAIEEKALIFTQFATMGHLLAEHLQATLNVSVSYLHGGVSKKERDRLVAEFQSEDGPPVFVLSLKAGGVGLNLTAATHVIHYDRWWNPAVEDQATDRAHRIGQTRRVQVRRLICAGTLEERIADLIATKRDLAERVVGSSDDAWVTELSTDDLAAVFTLSADAVAEAE
jgi:superfamily II DNA or RNA helicase